MYTHTCTLVYELGYVCYLLVVGRTRETDSHDPVVIATAATAADPGGVYTIARAVAES